MRMHIAVEVVPRGICVLLVLLSWFSLIRTAEDRAGLQKVSFSCCASCPNGRRLPTKASQDCLDEEQRRRCRCQVVV